jgi:hypothetical protein
MERNDYVRLTDSNVLKLEARKADPAVMPHNTEDCDSCGEDTAEVCPQSRRDCEHHCNHIWTHDACCWCGAEFDVDKQGLGSI